MTDPTEPDYVSYVRFGAEISKRLGHPTNRFPKLRVRKILWWVTEENGLDFFDKKMTDAGPLIALSEENIGEFIGLLPEWKIEAERRQNAEPIPTGFTPNEQLREWDNFASDYSKKYYEGYLGR